MFNFANALWIEIELVLQWGCDVFKTRQMVAKRRVGSLVKETGSIEIRCLERGVLLAKATGHIDSDIVAVMTGAYDAEIAIHGAPLYMFNDWSQVSSYDTRARIAATKHLLGSSRGHAVMHTLTQNKIVGMGVSVAKLALQIAGYKFYAHSAVASFEKELQRVRSSSC